MPNRFNPPSGSYPIETICAPIVDRLRQTRETAKTAIGCVNEAGRREQEAQNG